MSSSDKCLWEGAHETVLKDCGVLEIVGLSSPTHTAFARIKIPGSTPSTVQNVLDETLQVIQQHQHQLRIRTETSHTLLALGAVWKLTPPDNKPSIRNQKLKKTRLGKDNASDPLHPMTESLRVHFHPSRFPVVDVVDWSIETSANLDHDDNNHKPRAVIHSNQALGFLVIHKPSGLPCHATVDNGTENVLNEIETQFRRQTAPLKVKASAPYRLDIETEGLLLVATQREFAGYIGRLLQKKTMASHAYETINQHHNDSIPKARIQTIQKQYKCLVQLRDANDGTKLHEIFCHQNGYVEHYLDPHSAAPKTFATTPLDSKWLECRMRIQTVGSVMKLKYLRLDQRATPEQSSTLLVMEVEVELITGRTHQIRGQMAALGFPLVGDPLYGTSPVVDWEIARRRHNACDATDDESPAQKLALQCCAMAFPQPVWSTSNKKKPILVPDQDQQCSFHLDRAWWSDQLEPYERNEQRA